MKILLVEDDITLNRLVSKSIRKMNYSVDQAFDGLEAWEKYTVNQYEVIVLDINLPYLNGLELMEKIRKIDDQVKILILSAKDGVADKVKGFTLGTTDYLTKPFDILELEARINNLLHWKFEQESSTIQFGNLILNTKNNLFYFEDILLDFTRKEFCILAYLMHHQDTFVSAEEVIENVWESEVSLFSNSFKFHIYSLRQKLKDYCHNQILLTSKRTIGYRLEENNTIDESSR